MSDGYNVGCTETPSALIANDALPSSAHPKGSIKLSNAVEILSGFAFKSELFSDSDGIPIIRIRDVVRGFSETRYTGDFDAAYIIQNDEIVIGMDGNFNAAKWRGGPALLNQRVCRIKADTRILDEGYLFHFLPLALKKIEDATPFVTVKHLSVKDIREIDIPLPPLPEQRRIAAILDQADALRAKRREALAQLDSLTQSIFIEMFGDPLSSISTWPKYTFGDLLSHLVYGPRFYNDEYSQNGIRIVRITDLDEHGGLNFTEMPRMAVDESEIQKYALKEGDLIFARSGSVGKSAVFPKDAPPCIAGAYFIVMRFKDSVLPLFVRSVLATDSIQRFIHHRSRQAIQPNFSGPAIRELPLPVPPIDYQKTFVVRTRAIEKAKVLHKTSLAQLNQLFASLQHRAFRGEL